MNKPTSQQVFAFLAVGVMLLIAYAPPVQNSKEITNLLLTFFGYALHELFNTGDKP